MNGFTQKDCDFYDVIEQIEIIHKSIKINKNTIYSVVDKQNKRIINKTFEECFSLDNKDYKMREIISVDLEGNFVFEGDYIWYEDPSIGESLAEISDGCAVNIEHAYAYENSKFWKKCIVVGNIYEGLKINKYVMEKYCVDLSQLLNYKSFTIRNSPFFE